ncbi:MAG: DNA repair protein RecO [Acidimicrobiales bacterium]
MATYRDEGVVLRTMRLGEADRIVTLATPGHGKVRAVAKGIRKTKSRLAGRLEPITYVTVMCWRGRELDVVSQVEAIEHFKAIRGDLERVPVAMTMLEVVDNIALERHPMPEVFRMLVGALRTLEERLSPALLGSFLWKLLALEGVGPSLEQCAGCGSATELVAFDPGEGGFLCRSCRRGQAVGAETLSLIRQVLGGGLRSALDQPPGRATGEAERLALLATEYHLDRRVRSAHRGAEISTPGWPLGANTRPLDAADSVEGAGREVFATGGGEADSGAAAESDVAGATAVPQAAAEGGAALGLGPPPLAC